LFERLLLSDVKENKEGGLALANDGITITRSMDMLKEPYYVFEIFGVPEKQPMKKSDLDES